MKNLKNLQKPLKTDKPKKLLLKNLVFLVPTLTINYNRSAQLTKPHKHRLVIIITIKVSCHKWCPQPRNSNTLDPVLTRPTAALIVSLLLTCNKIITRISQSTFWKFHYVVTLHWNFYNFIHQLIIYSTRCSWKYTQT